MGGVSLLSAASPSCITVCPSAAYISTSKLVILISVSSLSSRTTPRVMKDTLKSIKLRRQNSTKSLASDLQIETEIRRVGSVTSLKSLGKDLISSFKRKEDENKEDSDSFQDHGGLTMKSKKIARRSLLRLRCDNWKKDNREWFLISSCLFFNQKYFSKFYFPRSSLMETPKKLGNSSRRNSLSTLSMPGKLSERQLMSLQQGEGSSRPVLRRDLPVCWLDMEQNIKENIFKKLNVHSPKFKFI